MAFSVKKSNLTYAHESNPHLLPSPAGPLLHLHNLRNMPTSEHKVGHEMLFASHDEVTRQNPVTVPHLLTNRFWKPFRGAIPDDNPAPVKIACTCLC